MDQNREPRHTHIHKRELCIWKSSIRKCWLFQNMMEKKSPYKELNLKLKWKKKIIQYFYQLGLGKDVLHKIQKNTNHKFKITFSLTYISNFKRSISNIWSQAIVVSQDYLNKYNWRSITTRILTNQQKKTSSKKTHQRLWTAT